MTIDVNPWDDTSVMLQRFDLDTYSGRIGWLWQRRNGIGSSECSSVLGLNPWPDATAWHVWMDKVALLPLDDGRDSEQMEIGREVESAIVRIVARRLGVEHYGIPALANRQHGWMRSNVDRVFVTNDGPIPFEAKNTSEYLLHEWIDQVPDHAELQILHTLNVTGAPYGYVGGMIGGRRVVFQRIDRNESLLQHIADVERELWDRVLGYKAAIARGATVDEAREEFEPTVTERDTVDSIIGAAPRRDVDEIVLTDEQAERARLWVADYQAAQLAEKSAQAGKDDARNKLVQLANGHTRLLAKLPPVSHPDMDLADYDEQAKNPQYEVIATVQRGNFAKARFIAAHQDIADVTMKKIEVLDVDALKTEHPDLYRQFQSRHIRTPKRKD
ncbi:RecE-like recombination exonuclease [Gordonia phage McKinley]|uniref:Exonuclease n=1 Tax=Gordonia phage McKinley TaxID=2588507 RepID=A0A4Y6ELX1_9CAUD|nr:RecE-like recombination exonuclease [Gordonia phage McKinley]QDF19472.1 exonuclease [Gordonia phage McKinley]